MSTTLESTVKTAVRSTVAAGRYLDKMKTLGSSSEGGESICIIRSGDKAIVGGHGKIFEDFVATKSLVGIFRPEESFLSVFHPDYEKSNLQILRFDQCFKKLPKDVSERE